ncbi:hypothetical protein [Marinifilum fragile]|uniref:hypothetical protein n=1 Tax=Marinifilum fragile TaxID=570161 RepID=UPI002AA6DD7C|nr:hypothetical protein [Marinifilum fragile]
MKTLAILTSLLLTFNISNAQEVSTKNSKNKIGVTYSVAESDVVHFQSLTGAASYNSENFYAIGLTYLHEINNWLDLETGIEYLHSSIVAEPNLPPEYETSLMKSDLSIISIPLTMRANFGKYFFLNGGLSIDIDTEDSSIIDSQSGIGGIVGLGAKYDFVCGASLFVNPYLKSHALIPFSNEKYHEHLMVSGVKVGLCYKF